MMCSMSGYWTLTATTRPSTSRARCTCASDAAATAVGENSLNTSAKRPAEVFFDHALDGRKVARRQAVVALRERLDVLRREDIRARADDLAHLHQHAAHRDRRVEDLVGVALMDRGHVALRRIPPQQPIPPRGDL